MIRTYTTIKSPDFDGAAADGSVNLADLVPVAHEFLGDSAPDCHDYDNDGETNLGDLIIMSPAFTWPSHCP